MATSNGLAPILPDALYPLDVLKRSTGLQDTAMRSARNNGMRVLYLGNRGFVYGRDFISHVLENARAEN